jgi:TetR/AcrR family transcriptional repressor of nem operon
MVRPREFETQTAVDQALGVFQRKGYKGSSLHDLISAMNISKSSFYETFGSKHELFLTTLARFHETRAVYCFIDPMSNIPAKSIIIDIFKGVIESVKEGKGGCIFGSCAIEFSDTDPELTIQISNGIKRLEQLFYQILIHGQKNKEISDKHNIRASAQLLTTTFYGLQVMANTSLHKDELDRIVLQSVAMLE